MKTIIKTADSINEWAGKIFSWSTGLLVAIIFIDVFCRYLFDFSFIWIVELETYFFAMTFLLASGYAFKHDKHVRVDLFYSNWSEKRKAWTNLLGGLLLLMPWCLISIMVCYQYVAYSFKINESSPQPGGLPALYILKSLLLISFLLLFVQGFSSILKSIQIIRSNTLPEHLDRSQKSDGTWEL